MSTPSKAPGRVIATISLPEPITIEPGLVRDLEEGASDPNVVTRLELQPITGAMLRKCPNAAGFHTGDIWAIGGRMAGLPEAAIRRVLGEMYAAELGRLTDEVGKALEPYQKTRHVPQTFDPHGKYTLHLETKVRLGSQEVGTIDFPRIKGAHMWESDPTLGVIGDVIDIAQDHTGQPSILFDRLTAADLGRVVAVESHFLTALRVTGG